MRVACVQNMAGEGLGRFDRLLRAAGHSVTLVAAHAGDAWPADDADGGIDAVVVGGSPLAAYDWHEHAFLREEAAFLRRAVAGGIPCLGICFGSQFLAQLLGGRAFRAPHGEIGAYEARLTEAGRSDPAFAGFPPAFPVFQWHRDTFDLPPGATLLATGDGIRHQAFRLGRVVAVQFHPEVTPEDVARWTVGSEAELAEAGKRAEQLVAECRAIDPELERLGSRLLGNFLATVR